MATDINRADELVCSQKEETISASTTTSANKYGGLVPKKRPLISKGHKRAFFDSADWALHKQEACRDQETIAAIESLRPKLQRTPRKQRDPRKPLCASGQENLAETSF